MHMCPRARWNDFATVATSVRALASDGCMPAAKTLRERGDAGLERAVCVRYGGVREVGRRLGLDMCVWGCVGNVEREVARVSQRFCEGCVPSLKVLRARGKKGIVGGVARHGGMRTVARAVMFRETWSAHAVREEVRRVGVRAGGRAVTEAELKRWGKRGVLSAARRAGGVKSVCREVGLASDDWRVWENVEREMRRVAARVGVEGCMPSREQIRVWGRRGVLNGVENVWGGVKKVGRRMGVFWGEWGVDEVDMEIRRIARHGVMPSERFMKRFGRRGLRHGVRKLGGRRAVAKRLGLSLNGSSG